MPVRLLDVQQARALRAAPLTYPSPLHDGSIRFTITAVSRPASALARLGGPLGRVAQSLMTRRYLRALDRR